MRLIVLPPRTGLAARPEASRTDVQVWRDAEGRVCARGYREAGYWVIDVPGVAVFRFGVRGAVAASPYPGARRRGVQDVFRRGIRPLVLQVRGTEVLHASAVIAERGIVGLCGESGTGKSTLAYALGLRGYPVWSDDAVPFRAGPDAVQALPMDFTIRLRPASASFFGLGETDDGEVFSVNGFGPGRVEVCPMAALCVLERAGDSARTAVEIFPLGPVQAFVALLPMAFCFSLDNVARKSAMVQQYLKLARRVPVFLIRFRPGLEGLGAVLDAIEQTACGRPRAAEISRRRDRCHI